VVTDFVRVSLNDLADYLERHGLQVVRAEDTGGVIYVDVKENEWRNALDSRPKQ
jgi:hypothetical protein